MNKPNLLSVSLPRGVVSLGNCVFYNCTSLVGMVIPSSVVNIGMGVFGNCAHLRSIVIPKSVTLIGQDTFANCPNLVVSIEKGSYAERYCLDNNVPYKILKDIEKAYYYPD